MQVIKNYNEGGWLIMSKDDERQIKLCLKKELTAARNDFATDDDGWDLQGASPL